MLLFKNNVVRWSLPIMAPIAAFCSSVTYANESQPGITELEEIIVSSQRREQSLQDIPITVNVISADELESRQFNELADIANSLVLVGANYNPGGITNYYIRGIGLDDFNLSAIPSVGIYSNEVAITNPMAANLGLFDIERVEVLKGPQNTLFGNNTSGGAINVITGKPDLTAESLSGYLRASLGSFEEQKINAAINVNASANLGFRIAGFSRQRDGLVASTVAGNDTEYGDIDQQGLRLQSLWAPTDKLSLLASFETARQNQINPIRSLLEADADGIAIDPSRRDAFSTDSQLINPPNDIDTDTFSLRIDYALERVDFTGISAYQTVESLRADDWGPQLVSSSVPIIINYSATDTEQLSQEFQFRAKPEQPLQWLAGYLYSEEKGQLLQAAYIDPLGGGRPDDAVTTDAGTGPLLDRAALVDLDTVTHSVYGQLEYMFVDKWAVVAGYRWSRQDIEPTVASAGMMMDLPGQEFPLGSFGWFSLGNPDFDINRDAVDFTIARNFKNANGGYPAQTDIDRRFTEWGGKLGLQYFYNEDVMSYVSVSRGFKQGTVDSNPTTVTFASLIDGVVTPETLITYELGFKSFWLNKQLKLDGALFYNDWEDYQYFLVSNPGAPQDLLAQLVNVPEARTKGIELDAVWIINQHWRLQAALGLLNTEVTNGNLDTTGVPAAGVETFQSQIVSGNELTNSPDKTYQLALQNIEQTPWGELTSQLNYRFIDSHPHQIRGTNTAEWFESFSEDDVALWSFNSLLRFGSQAQYSVSVWGKNISDEKYCVERAQLPGVSGNPRLCSYAQPRSWGVAAGYDFQ